MYGADIERVLSIVCQINNETANQIEALSKVSDYRIETIKHTHNVHVEGETKPASGGTDVSGDHNHSEAILETVPDGAHSHGGGDHVHGIDIKLQGDTPYKGEGTVRHVSDQLTYPEDYSNDAHPSHPHVEDSVIYEKEHIQNAWSFIESIYSLGQILLVDEDKIKNIESNLYTSKNNFNNTYGSPYNEIYDLKKKIDLCEEYAKSHPQLQWIGEKLALLNLLQMVLSISIDAKFALIIYHDNLQRGYDAQFNNQKSSITWDDYKDGNTSGNIKQ